MGTRTNEEQQVRALLKEHGCTVLREARHGDIWALPGGETIQCYSETDTGSRDWRAWKNCLSELRRKLRAAGVLLDESQTGEVEQPEPEEGEEVDLQSLGVHVARSTKKVVTVIETETAEATVTVAALGQLLGLADMGDKVEIQVLTFDDNVVGDQHSTFKFKVVRETIKEEEEAA